MRKLFIAALMLLALPLIAGAQDGGTITYDQIVTGTISDSTPAVNYTFNGSAGDVIQISMKATQQGLDSYLELRDANGNVIYTDDDAGGNLNAVIGPTTLPATGVYTIVATRCCGGQGTSTGTFELTLSRAQLTPLALNETYTIQLTPENPSAFFTYSAAQKEVLSVAGGVTTDSVGANLEIRDPQGTWINSGYGSRDYPILLDPLYLGAAGQYLFILRREATYGPNGQQTQEGGPVTVALTVRSTESTPIALDVPVSGTLNDQNPSDYYTFNARRGDILRLAGDQPADAAPFEIQVFNPSGFSFNGGSPSYSNTPLKIVIDPLTIDTDGEYLIVVRRLNTGSPVDGTTSAYMLTLSATQTPELQNGVEITGTVGGQVYEQVYRFAGTAGQTIRMTLRSVNDSYGPTLNIQGPSQPVEPLAAPSGGGIGGGGDYPGGFYMSLNSSVPSTYTYEAQLPFDGIYLFRVSNGIYLPEGPSIGEFGLKVEIIP